MGCYILLSLREGADLQVWGQSKKCVALATKDQPYRAGVAHASEVCEVSYGFQAQLEE